MNNQGPLSPPSSVASSSEWSASRYQNSSPKPYNAPSGRANLATPPISVSSMNGMNGPYGPGPGMNGMGGPPRPGEFRGNPSPPSSVGRSSNGTQMSTDAQRRKQSMMEDSLAQHYVSLKRYLASSLQAEAADGRPNRARDKLVRLSPTQFQELSTDVYDELLRRQAQQAGTLPPNSPAFLAPRDTFHPKRNQARQKLSTLPAPRFRALATDVFFELERRFPRFAAGNIGRGGSPAMGPPSRTGTPNGMRPGSGNSQMGQMRRPPPRQGSLGGQVLAGGMPGMTDGPMQKAPQSNMIVPNKSYLVEDDDEGDLDSVYGGGGGKRDTTATNKSSSANEKIISDYQNKVEELQGKVGDLEKQVQEKDDALQKATTTHQGDRDNASAEWARVREGLEQQVTDAQNLHSNLQSEIDRMKAQHEDREQDFEEQLSFLAKKGNDDGEWRSRFEEGKRINDDLQRDLEDQQRVTDEVRRETASLLSEMRAISEQHDASYQREEGLAQQVFRLEDDLKEWKSRYALVKTQVQNESGATTNLAVQQPTMAKQGFVQPDGLIKDVHLTSFQLAIDDAIRASRSTDSGSLMDAVKAVVIAVKGVCEDIPKNSNSDPASQKRLKLRNKVNATASNFITASKNHAASKGLSPVSLVDAAASHLSTAVIELVHLVKLRTTPAGDLDLDEDPMPSYPEKSSKYFSSNGRSSVTDSVYSNNTAAHTSQKMSILPNTSYRVPSTNSFVNGGGPGGNPNFAAQNGYDVREGDEDVDALRLFLDDQNVVLVETTQTLVQGLRAGAPAAQVLPHVAAIANLINGILQQADPVLDANPALNSAAGPVMQNLAQGKARLLAAEDDGRDARSEEEWRSVANRIPPVAFEIARMMRDFGAVLAADDEDDFR